MKTRNEGDALASRIEALAKEGSVTALARALGTSAANVSRYINGTRIPAEFCITIVRKLGVNPVWLMTGEGARRLSDVDDGTGRLGGDVLELVEAMNSVTRMRLGALTDKHHARVLRELNDALDRFEKLRERLNDESTPIFSTILDKLDNALARRDVTRAADLQQAALQVERLCVEPELSRRFLKSRARLAMLEQNTRESLRLQRLAARDRLTDSETLDEEDAGLMLGLGLGVHSLKGPRSALRIFDAAVALFPDDAAGGDYSVIRALRGHCLADLGKLYEGMELIARELPLLRDQGNDRARLFLQRLQIWNGALTPTEALAVGADIDRKFVHVAEIATLHENRELCGQVVNAFESPNVRTSLAFAHAIEHARAISNNDKTAPARLEREYQSRGWWGPNVATENLQLCLIHNQRKRALALWDELIEAFDTLNGFEHFGMVPAARFYRCALAMPKGATRQREFAQRAQDFAQQAKANAYHGLIDPITLFR